MMYDSEKILILYLNTDIINYNINGTVVEDIIGYKIDRIYKSKEIHLYYGFDIIGIYSKYKYLKCVLDWLKLQIELCKTNKVLIYKLNFLEKKYKFLSKKYPEFVI